MVPRPTSEADVQALQKQIDADFPVGSTVEWPGGWPNEIEAALIDAVFSIRARYGTETTGVRRVVAAWRAARGSRSLDDLNVLAGQGELNFVELNINSAKASGRLKSELVVEASAGMAAVDVCHAGDLADESRQAAARNAYLSVKGLGPVTWSYFTMLLGYPDVKADVHILNYVKRAICRESVTPEEARSLLTAVASTFSDLTHLDHAIWRSERGRN